MTTEELTHKELFSALAEANRKRAAVYGLLSRIYRVEMNQAFLDELKGMRFPANTGNELVDEGYRMMATYLASAWENTALELAIDYVQTFIGNGVNSFAAAYPYESVYTSEKRLMMQEARDQVLALYREHGLEKQESWHDNEDHIALEMEFMQVLANRAAEALEREDETAAIELMETQQEFVKVHLGLWAPVFTVDMREYAKTDFYQALARLTDGFLETEREFFDSVLAEEEE